MAAPDRQIAPRATARRAPRGRVRRGRLGFTLIEVLFAIGIFAIGFAAVAAVFPVAIMMQKRTFDRLNAEQAARNAEAMMRGSSLHQSVLEAGFGLGLLEAAADFQTDQRIRPLPAAMLQATIQPHTIGEDYAAGELVYIDAGANEPNPDQDDVYVCLEPHNATAGNAPTPSADLWRPLNHAAATQQWDNVTTYSQGDPVYYFDAADAVLRLYVSNANSNTDDPTAGTGSWTRVQQLTLADRGYPTAHGDEPVLRDTYWIPLIRDADADPGGRKWQVYLFVVQAGATTTYTRDRTTASTYDVMSDFETTTPTLDGEIWANPGDGDMVPGVRRVPVRPDTTDATRFEFDVAATDWNDEDGDGLWDHISPGDEVLDCYGITYRVNEVDATGFKVAGFVAPNPETGQYPDAIWFVQPQDPNGGVDADPRGGERSPTVTIRILVGDDLVETP